MKKIFIVVLLCIISFISMIQAQVIRVASYNLRMDTPQDSLNSWSHRKENVKALIQYHD
ncbi:hypothetical protein EZS27_043380, partial [termite gut metagenome]